MKDIQETIEKIESELRESPGEPDLHNELGIGYHMLGEYGDAIQEFKKAVERSPKVAKYHFNLANSYYESDRIELAINSYMDAIDLKPDYVPAINNLADIYEIAGKTEKARELFEYITRIEPENALGYLNLGNHFLRDNDTVEAGKNYRKAIELDSACYEAYNNIGFILKHLGKYEEALPYFEKCLQINPDYQPAIKDLEKCREELENT